MMGKRKLHLYPILGRGLNPDLLWNLPEIVFHRCPTATLETFKICEHLVAATDWMLQQMKKCICCKPAVNQWNCVSGPINEDVPFPWIWMCCLLISLGIVTDGSHCMDCIYSCIWLLISSSLWGNLQVALETGNCHSKPASWRCVFLPVNHVPCLLWWLVINWQVCNCLILAWQKADEPFAQHILWGQIALSFCNSQGISFWILHVSCLQGTNPKWSFRQKMKMGGDLVLQRKIGEGDGPMRRKDQLRWNRQQHHVASLEMVAGEQVRRCTAGDDDMALDTVWVLTNLTRHGRKARVYVLMSWWADGR